MTTKRTKILSGVVSLAIAASAFIPAGRAQAASPCVVNAFMPVIAQAGAASEAMNVAAMNVEAIQAEGPVFPIHPGIGAQRDTLGPIYADFDHDGCDDLLVGVPYETIV